ncbi:MAG: hypothetical protein K0S45_3549 [Nitrospira sp.]|nr:hypothetical protein [Nitrospira sp.]
MMIAVRHSRSLVSPQDAQKRSSGKAAASEEGIVRVPYGEPLSDARTSLAGFFRILLEAIIAIASGSVKLRLSLVPGTALPFRHAAIPLPALSSAKRAQFYLQITLQPEYLMPGDGAFPPKPEIERRTAHPELADRDIR